MLGKVLKILGKIIENNKFIKKSWVKVINTFG